MTALGMGSTRWVALSSFEVVSMDEMQLGPAAKVPL